MKELTDKQKVKFFEKEGYTIEKIGNRNVLCSSLKIVQEEQDLIFSNYLHRYDCCSKCRKKIYNQRMKIKKNSHIR